MAPASADGPASGEALLAAEAMNVTATRVESINKVFRMCVSLEAFRIMPPMDYAPMDYAPMDWHSRDGHYTKRLQRCRRNSVRGDCLSAVPRSRAFGTELTPAGLRSGRK